MTSTRSTTRKVQKKDVAKDDKDDDDDLAMVAIDDGDGELARDMAAIEAQESRDSAKLSLSRERLRDTKWPFDFSWEHMTLSRTRKSKGRYTNSIPEVATLGFAGKKRRGLARGSF